MAWETELSSTVDGDYVEYQTRNMVGYSRAERPDRVLVNGYTVHEGWACSGISYAFYRAYIEVPIG